jgi:hypothetical protein
MSYDKFPDRLSSPMSRGQATLRDLSVESYQPKLFEENLAYTHFYEFWEVDSKKK